MVGAVDSHVGQISITKFNIRACIIHLQHVCAEAVYVELFPSTCI